MKLMTKKLESKIPKLYTTEDIKDPIIVGHYFNPSGVGDWYIIEGERQDDDFVFYGLVDLMEKELGYFSLNELKNLTLPFGLKIERDLYWNEKKLSQLL